MSESLFDGFVTNYEDACERGLSLSGENRDFFARARVRLTKQLCAAPAERIVDFGCGLGHTVPYLAESYEDATVIGIDSSSGAIEAATRKYGGPRIRFSTSLSRDDAGSVGLVYSNGTFHHILPGDRGAVVRGIFDGLKPGGMFALWENNPWNPGTRLVMKRIPFDRDAQTLSWREASHLLRSGGFEIAAVSFHFYFPGVLRALRACERYLTRIPFGAQYCVVGKKPEGRRSS